MVSALVGRLAGTRVLCDGRNIFEHAVTSGYKQKRERLKALKSTEKKGTRKGVWEGERGGGREKIWCERTRQESYALPFLMI